MYDLVVIGAGMSGLMAAGAGARRQKKVLVVAKGQGALSLSSGCIDFNPGLLEREEGSPYFKVREVVEESFNFFKYLVKRCGLNYVGSPSEQTRIFTTLGTVKNSCLVPESMFLENPDSYERIIAVGFKGYFDFSPKMFLYYAKKSGIFPGLKETEEVYFEPGVRTVNTTWLAQALTRGELKEKLIAFLKPYARPKTLMVFPAVLGDLPEDRLFKEVEEVLGVKVVELPGGFPSVPGQRLHKALVSSLKEMGVNFLFNAEVIGYKKNLRQVTSIKIKESGGRVREISGKAFVLATGSFWGKGLRANTEEICEPIFQSKVYLPRNFAEDFNFLASGIYTDEYLRPIKELENLYGAGSILANSNYLKNNSGLGLALATGYKAGLLALGDGEVRRNA
ncbi:anaerobic glycerol-3-phosphate dehydrogenase subunit B [Carboxydothermus islandicus]|uniref:Anaerobic glycerol-3-phosphate dehydrogenase subunit B n=1 Tax=Carboxydothermus islandicus TaxID=661089 RepID=A0A1L8D2H0_9THEO|nr:anaerobic glycerol-3-phosphate dehydrogenase subunit B [Carboxydothermus islandicus]GAV25370.1 anaerobic glycerol-3-phosphate dehydrogenase subunit B [Carboxydothermus islandicus]